MQPLPAYVWREFQSALTSLDENSSARDILGVILSWIRSNRRLIFFEPFSTYGIDAFLKIEEETLPVERSSFIISDLPHLQQLVINYRAKDVDAISQFLRDTIEALVTITIEEKCPRCKSDGMRVFIGRYNKCPAFQCDVCGHAYYSNGAGVERNGLEFASEEQLQEYGFL